MDTLLAKIRKCTLCAENLPFAPRPILQFGSSARIMIIGQAPGLRAHESKIPWNDPSGDRLRQWLNISREIFYNENKIAIVPMGFCYPGKGKSGDNPPRPECRQTWMGKVLKHLKHIELKIIIGKYACEYFLKDNSGGSLVETLKNHKPGKQGIIVLPHPSPRNNIFLSRYPWIEKEIVPSLQKQVARVLSL